MKQNVFRRSYLAVSGAVVAGGLAGCLGDDDENGVGDDDGNGGSDGTGNGDGAGGAGAADPLSVCDTPETNDREALLPEGDPTPDLTLTNTIPARVADFQGSFQSLPPGGGDPVQHNYGGVGLSYDADEEDEFSAWVVEFENQTPHELEADQAFRIIEPAFTPDYQVAQYILLDRWAWIAGGSDEQISGELLAAFPAVSEECAAASTTVTREA